MSGHCVPTLQRKKRFCEEHKTTCYFDCFRKDAGISLEKKIIPFLSLSHTQILGAHISLSLRGPLAIGQAGNLASPPLSTDLLEKERANDRCCRKPAPHSDLLRMKRQWLQLERILSCPYSAILSTDRTLAKASRFGRSAGINS
ncbi:hypothetical protein AVEN_143036-1 [Araneus ventricosus]|uniref:Uncharacterized protein n=1 Tax=Araneus ventricosus TaxID=182803 RepID=A0A4Y2KSE2_ARAVE|nr:hypothetical protein AVEN_143036-1 [Araneus ventricosus]